jgi:hypothetical protein
LRHSRWPCRPRTTLRQASPDGVSPGGAIQGDRCEFVHYTGSDGQSATRRGPTACLCTSMIRLPLCVVRPPATVHRWSDHQTWPVRPPAPGTEALSHVLGTHGRVCATTVKLWCQHTFWRLCWGESLVRSKPRHSTPYLLLRSVTTTSSWPHSTMCQKKFTRHSRNTRGFERRRRCRSFLHAM